MMCRPAQISIGIMNDGPGKIRRWSQRIKHHQVVLLSARSALCCSRARRRSVPKVRAHRFSVCLQQAGTNQHRNNERWSRKNTALVPSDQAPSYCDFRGGGPLFLLARDPQLRFTRARFDEVFERAPLEFADEETRGSFIWAAALRNSSP